MSYNAGYPVIKEVDKFLNRKVTLVGVVVEFSIPRMSRGTDYVSILRIVDDTQQSPELLVNIFTKKIDDLPHVRSHGDLILLSHVVIRNHGDVMSAVCYKDSASFALFDGNRSNDFCYYQATRGFALNEVEKPMINHLRQWHGGIQLSIGEPEHLLSLRDISAGKPFDLICKVVRVYYDAIEKVWMLLLWDGTDAPPLSLHGKLKDDENNPLPLHIEPNLMDKNFYRTLPSCGTFLSVTADETHENFGQHFSYVDKWVRICYMSCEAASGLWHGLLNPSTSVRLLADEIAEEYEGKYQIRIERENGRLPQWVELSSHFLTDFDCEGVSFSTLMDVLRYAELQVSAKFYCVVRVLAIHPFQAQDFCSSDGSNEHRIRLTIEDSAARIHAFLVGEEWVRFFEACPVDERNTKVKLLLGVPEEQSLDYDNEFLRNPPWIKCCIESRDGLFYVCSTKLVL